MAKAGRGRLSGIELLPEECNEIVAWANQELQNRERTQQDIYVEFRDKLIALQGELGLGFDIPSRTAFNRRATKVADMTRRLEETRVIASQIAPRFTSGTSDEMTMMVAELIKTVIFETLINRGEGGIDPKGIMEMARALQASVGALKTSSERVQAVQKIKGQVGQALDAVEGGLDKGGPPDGLAVLRKIREEVYGIFEPQADAR